ncbi:MAG: hypothetical protein GY799_08010 [Desulfobulbaceae bacterium]|nr:hypothetical protein [Desulfobulbaceae bacterium]
MFLHRAKRFFIIVTILLASCSSENYEPTRPVPVPNEAMWIGGIDGGAWVLLRKQENQPDHIYYAEVYGDQVGDPWYIGRLEVIPHSKPNVPLDNPEAYGVWDGDSLLLEDGRSMRTIDKFDPFKK